LIYLRCLQRLFFITSWQETKLLLLAVGTIPLRHPSGATGYRFGEGSCSLAIITDIEHEPDGPSPELVRFCSHTDTIVYDTMLPEHEYDSCKGWGHSTVTEAVGLAKAANARRLIGFHHSPKETDAETAEREQRMQALFAHSAMAREGQTLICGDFLDARAMYESAHP
jgi:ribonuclease BN (tRNA processing enzyme)